MQRQVQVRGSGPGGFVSALTLMPRARVTREQVDYFAPGVVYGSTAHLLSEAIGNARLYGPGYAGVMRVREDRLPAPLFGVRFRDGSSLTVLDAHLDARTTTADGADADGKTQVDERLRFGAIGADQPARRLSLGYWFPGAEGEVTYGNGATATPGPAGRHRWRRREHPLRDGLRQSYRLQFRFGARQAWNAYEDGAWRWARRTLRPRLHTRDQDTVRRVVVSMLADRVVTTPHGTGIPYAWDVTTGKEILGREGSGYRPAVLGFVGRNVEDATLLIRDAVQHPGPASARHRRLGEAMIKTFTHLNMSPPEAAGIDLQTGNRTSFYPKADVVFLRQLSETFAGLTEAILSERAHGHEHPGWVAWAREFANWMIARQGRDGSFPRAWHNATGVVADASQTTTDQPVGFLLNLSTITGDRRYARAALRAGRYAWPGHRRGQYAGATLDQGNSIAKEAADAALQADMALFEHTGDRRWLRRAIADAKVAETWSYVWDVPMPTDGDTSRLGWKPGVPTTGASLVATGSSAVDEYQLEIVPELAQLAAATGDRRWLDDARLTLHDSAAMLALPGHTFDLVGPGWQQEFFNMGPDRGVGTILGGRRDWVPWIAAVRLRALLVTEQQTPKIWRRLARR